MGRKSRISKLPPLICAFVAYAIAGAAAQTEAKSVFRHTRLADDLIRIEENSSVNMYLVMSEKKALLIDTGMGGGDLGAYVKNLTNLPVLVVNTHGHLDHAGGNRYFEKIFAHPADMSMVRRYSPGKNDITPVREGDVFDLGGRKLTVIDSPGHTAGSICLLDGANRMLFTGDNNNTETWMFLAESLTLETYGRSLDGLISREGEFDVLYPGHGAPLKPTFLDRAAACVKHVLAGECSAKPFKKYPGMLYCTHRGAMIVYNPNKLKEQP